MIRRYREIISKILNTEDCITGNELAKLCNVSVRTIRLDIKEINNILKEYNIKIDSVFKKGYYLTKKYKKDLKENNIIRSVLDYEYIAEIPNTPRERQMYIISKLTIKEYISIEELADKLYVSTATVSNDINFVKKWLKENLNLNINYSLSKGIKLKVTEKEKRNIISWILSDKLNASTIMKHWNYLFEEEIMSKFNSIYKIVEDEIKKFGYYLSGHSCQLLCFEIFVAMRRCELGYNLEEIDKVNEELTPVMIALRERIQAYLMVTLSELEWLNLQQYFKSKQFINETNIKNIETKESIHIVDEFLMKLHNKFSIDLGRYSVVKDKLLLYVAPMINRLKYRHCIGNKINKDVTQTYLLEFEMATEISHIIKKELNLNTSLIELAYITMHLVSTQNIWSYRLNTIVVCDFDESIISFIKEKIINYLGEKIKFYGCYTYNQFKFQAEKNLKEIDFIITTSTLADITNIPFVQISPTIEQKDIINLYEYLDNLKKFNKI